MTQSRLPASLLIALTALALCSCAADDNSDENDGGNGDDDSVPDCERNEDLLGTWFSPDEDGYDTWYILEADGTAREEMFHPDGDSDENEVTTGYWCATEDELTVVLDIQDGDYVGTYEMKGGYVISGDNLYWSAYKSLAFRTSGDAGSAEGTWSLYSYEEENWISYGAGVWSEHTNALDIEGKPLLSPARIPSVGEKRERRPPLSSTRARQPKRTTASTSRQPTRTMCSYPRMSRSPSGRARWTTLRSSY